jgi:hypothetical protein
MAARKTKPKNKPSLVLRSYRADEGVQDTLDSISRDLTDILGHPVSQSAVIRGLIRWAARQEYEWLKEQLSLLVEGELNAGVSWGRRVGWSRGKRKE